MDPVELLSTVNAFYDQAFNKLMTVTFGVLTIIGLFVPLDWICTSALASK